MVRGRTVIGVVALVTGAMLALAGNELARAGVSSAPFPSAVVAAAPVPGQDVPPPGAPGGADAVAGTEAEPDDPGEGSGSGSRSAAEPADREPAPPGPADREPATPDPVDDEPAGRDPGNEKPAPPAPPNDDPPAKDPPAKDPPVKDPAVKDPAATDPAATDPAATDPPDTDPPDTDPADTDPADKDPADTGPGDRDPAAPKSSTATTAAERFGWGTPLPGSDEFGYTGKPDPAKWNVAGECWAGHAGNGGRCASRSTVDGSKLVQTGLANGDSGWLASKTSQRYGRWEARVRSEATGQDNGRQYHPLLIVWPSSNRWPQDGEYDFLENGAPGQDCAESFIHYPHDAGVGVQQEFIKEKNCGAPLSRWHNVALEWTPDHVRGYIDGKKWFDLSGGASGIRRKIQDMPAGHLTIQLDNFFGGNMQPATYEVDWVRIYALR